MASLNDGMRPRTLWRRVAVLLVVLSIVAPGAVIAPESAGVRAAVPVEGLASATGDQGIAPQAEIQPLQGWVWPDCNWKCTAGDLIATRAWLGTADQEELPRCTPGDPVTATIWVDFETSNPTRYSVIFLGDLYVGDAPPVEIDVCSTTVITGGMSIPVYEISWTCGVAVEIQDVVVAWDADPKDPCVRVCTAYPSSKCYKTDVLRVDAPLVASFTSNSPQCLGTAIVFTPSVTGGSEPYTLLWEYGDGITETVTTVAPVSHLYSLAGSHPVTLTVTDSVGRTASATGSATVSPNPQVSVTPESAQLTCAEPQATLTASATGTGTLHYQWYQNGSTVGTDSSEHTVSATGTYYVVVTDDAGCTGTSNEVTVTQAEGPTVSVEPESVELTCAVPEATLTAYAEGTGTIHYQWYQNGSAVGTHSSEHTVSAIGTYYVVVTDDTGCEATSNSVTVTQAEGPTVSVEPESVQLDCETGEALLTAWVTAETEGYTLQWYKDNVEIAGATGETYTATEAGTYHVVVTDDNGCSAASNRVPVTPCLVPGLAITKTGDKTVARIGDVINYSIVVENTGDVTLWYVHVADEMLGIDDVIESLAPEDSKTYTGSYTVSEGDLPGPIVNTAKAWTEPLQLLSAAAAADYELYAEDSWSVLIETEPGLAISKTGDRTAAKAGDVVNYTIVVSNNGDVTLTDVQVDDAKLGLHETIASLAASASQTFSGSYTVSQGDLPGPLVNKATAASGELYAEDSWSVSLAGPTPEPCIRTDVTVVIHGGWAGIPVKVWVGGTEQDTRSTGTDSSGRAVASWTFYPPEGTTWQVRAEPQLPAGLDAARWKYEPTSKQVSIRRCSSYTLEFQLKDTGPQATPTPELILPVTGERPAEPGGWRLYDPGWLQRYVRWWQSLLGKLLGR